MPKIDEKEIDAALEDGIVFRGKAKDSDFRTKNVKTKAHKKDYKTGAHGSASAKHKASFKKR